MSPDELKKAETKYLVLLKTLGPVLGRGDTNRLHKAFRLSIGAFGQSHPDEEPGNIYRQLAVAQILAHEMGMGPETVLSVFLFDLRKNNHISRETTVKEYGPTVATVTDGLLAITSLNFRNISIETENFRKLLLSISHDIRSILIRMALTLYELRNFQRFSADDQPLILRKAAHIYGPFAHRLGLYAIKTQLEDYVMKLSQPAIYDEIAKQVTESRPKQEAIFDTFIRPLRQALTEEGLNAEFKWRFKSIPGIYQKMKKQGVDIHGIHDLFAIRIILSSTAEKEKADCWKAYSIVSSFYPPDTSRLRDWISKPRPSGYESLHTTVSMPGSRVVEVQIRSKRMDEIAEKGDAAHWRYKESGKGNEMDTWLREMRNMLETRGEEGADLGNDPAPGLQSPHIYALTPAGDIKQLPAGASILDFAFEVHSSLGSSCTGARVNGKAVPIKYLLSNGDIVEILTSKKQLPKLDWLQYCITSKARSRIKRALNEDRMRDAELGKSALQRRCRNWKLQYNEELIDKLLKHFRFKTALDLYAALAAESIDWAEVKRVASESGQPETQAPLPRKKKNKTNNDQQADETLIIGDGDRNLDYSLAKCCSPIHGDEIFGFVTISRGISIHRKNCPNAASLVSRHDYRVIEARWDSIAGQGPYQVLLRITGDDRLGLLSELTQTITDELKINITGISIDSRSGLFDGKIRMTVNDRSQLDHALYRLARIKGVARIKRYYD
jgi:GTP pyrophosphokinase